MEITSEISTLKNVGKKRTELLNKVGIYTVFDLMEYVPRDYTDRSKFSALNDVTAGEEAIVKVRIKSKPEAFIRGRLRIVRTAVYDETGEAAVIWFNMPYLKNTLKPKDEYLITGKAEIYQNRLTFTSPDFEAVKEEESINTGRIVPKYHLTKNLNQKLLRRLIYDTLTELEPQIKEYMPQSVLERNDLCSRIFALKNIHFPESDEAFFQARRRLVFDELFLLRLRFLTIRGEIKKENCGIPYTFFETDRITEALPFKLTQGQQQVIDEITEDLSSSSPMNRLVQGDVGSGKTAIAEIACYLSYINGAQSAVMAPTDVLATQHFQTFAPLFERLGIKTVLLKGSLPAKEKREIKKMIKSGEADIIIGTHALIQKGVEFKELGLVITDEQHRFGVNQRRLLTAKGKNPHTLVMSATPIPRTLGLILYGDLDISTITTMPSGRAKTDTFYVTSAYRQRFYGFILNQIKEGRQAYIVCAAIEENEKSNLKAVNSYIKSLDDTCLRDVRKAFVHGKMKPEEKQQTMNDFAEGKIDILIATTVIEVGINVPNASVMLIEDADRFGLSQLHQLRGRVGRGEYKSYCILVSDTKSAPSKERLKTMTKTADGFELSEKDLTLRGPGDFFGTLQHGLPPLKIANLYKDGEILKEAQNAVQILYEDDPELKKSPNQPLKERLFELYEADKITAPSL
ncbi:MAG: ATP-dependent DNA helicase RecG [Clostridiales bacterium]|nr:ATP-dependent DNA helicase RecG [Clostridiales bacterium]